MQNFELTREGYDLGSCAGFSLVPAARWSVKRAQTSFEADITMTRRTTETVD